MGVSGCWYHVHGKGGADTFSRYLMAIGDVGEHMCELEGLDLGFIDRNLASFKF